MRQFKCKIIVQKEFEEFEAFGDRIEEFCDSIKNLKKTPKIALNSSMNGRQTALIQYIIITPEKDSDEKLLTKARAQIALLEGNKISHILFTKDEFIQINEFGRLIDENSSVLNKQEFWIIRSGCDYDNGWYIIDESSLS